jgi:5-oxoprolinase (ATP-hydrolysing) subunit C
MNSDGITVTEAGMAAITDLGRPRGARFGVPVNGALDHYSARAANGLVGNADNAPLIEITALDFELRSDIDILIAVTGAHVTLRVRGVEQGQWEPVSVRAGETVSIREMSAGVRSYLAVRGSFDRPMLLGSCAPDSVLGFGRPLAVGDLLPNAPHQYPIRTSTRPFTTFACAGPICCRTRRSSK